ncbi:hypothetical protein [Ktedonospora formicarum]|uniref:Uncharacterized protein n=1 Tax=Ktedonospora formicarum TaxID=2778364 RepID=A0A8J3I1K8_9CHLR|nr:hypothetical protein [Ktedonospora formicarum]GHO45916.1 hypothetical protein KSX_40790 [Ktedonospora formicarum]
MNSRDSTLTRAISTLEYRSLWGRRPPLREIALLMYYHLRLLKWWPFLLMFLSFLGLGALLWYQLHLNDTQAISSATALSRFVMESVAGFFAGMFASALIVGDPLLEIMIVTRSGLYKIICWRAVLSLFMLLLPSAVFLAWSLGNGLHYAQQESLLFLMCVWLAPVLLMAMIGLLGSLFTHNTALGFVASILPLALALAFYPFLLPHKRAHSFFIPYTSWGPDAIDWWNNRLTLLGIALLLAACNWWWLHHEELLLGNAS